MNKRTVLHIVMLAITAAVGGVVDHLTQSHAVWAPIAVALLTDLKPLIASIGAAPPTAALVLALAVATGGSFGCWLTKPAPISPTVPDGGFADASAGQTWKDCNEDALHKAWVSVLPDIETAVATSAGAVDAIVAQVAATAGVPLAVAEVKCGLQYLVDRITHSQQTAPDSLEATKLANAQAWLAAHP